MRVEEMITQERLKELLDYDPETGAFAWKVTKGRRAKTGRRAGCVSVHGYIIIQIDGKHYPAHRLAWLHVYGQWPKVTIDHINRVRDDNRLENLREATKQQQGFNRGAKGYTWHKQTKKWVAQIGLNGRLKNLGYYETEEEAGAAYLAAKAELHIMPAWHQPE